MVDELSSAASVALAWARVAWAEMTAALSAVGSRVASVCPAVTWSPMATGTDFTDPETWNEEVAWLALRTVPLRVSVWSTEPLVTVPSRYVGSPLPLAKARVPKTPPTTSTTTSTGTPRRTQSRLWARGFVIRRLSGCRPRRLRE